MEEILCEPLCRKKILESTFKLLFLTQRNSVTNF